MKPESRYGYAGLEQRTDASEPQFTSVTIKSHFYVCSPQQHQKNKQKLAGVDHVGGNIPSRGWRHHAGEPCDHDRFMGDFAVLRVKPPVVVQPRAQGQSVTCARAWFAVLRGATGIRSF